MPRPAVARPPTAASSGPVTAARAGAGGVNDPGAITCAIVMVALGSLSPLRLSHVALPAGAVATGVVWSTIAESNTATNAAAVRFRARLVIVAEPPEGQTGNREIL